MKQQFGKTRLYGPISWGDEDPMLAVEGIYDNETEQLMCIQAYAEDPRSFINERG